MQSVVWQHWPSRAFSCPTDTTLYTHEAEDSSRSYRSLCVASPHLRNWSAQSWNGDGYFLGLGLGRQADGRFSTSSHHRTGSWGCRIDPLLNRGARTVTLWGTTGSHSSTLDRAWSPPLWRPTSRLQLCPQIHHLFLLLRGQDVPQVSGLPSCGSSDHRKARPLSRSPGPSCTSSGGRSTTSSPPPAECDYLIQTQVHLRHRHFFPSMCPRFPLAEKNKAVIGRGFDSTNCWLSPSSSRWLEPPPSLWLVLVSTDKTKAVGSGSTWLSLSRTAGLVPPCRVGRISSRVSSKATNLRGVGRGVQLQFDFERGALLLTLFNFLFLFLFAPKLFDEPLYAFFESSVAS